MITDLWRQQAGKYFCISSKTSEGRWFDKLFRRSQLDKVADYVRERRDRNVYFCPHGFSERHRLKQFAVMPTLLWSDMDERDPRDIELKPTIAIESSPGRHVGLWLTDDVVTEELNERLAKYLGDKQGGWDLTQVLRLPGTINYKYAAMPRVRVLWRDGPTYSVRDLSRTLPKLEKRKAATGGGVPVERLMRWASVRTCMGKAVKGQRSTMIARLIYALDDKGCSRDGIAWALMRCPSFIDKRGHDERRAYKEIDNCLRNKT
jgi:hypothetical protein